MDNSNLDYHCSSFSNAHVHLHCTNKTAEGIGTIRYHPGSRRYYLGGGLSGGFGYKKKKTLLSQVFFESEKDKLASLEGKIIFDLERYLLLFTESKSIVAIPPHEKIRSIQTPPLPVAKKPTPAVASPTPPQASTSPKETPQVSPSPVQSPTATAEPQKK
jgi:hypothetical protein